MLYFALEIEKLNSSHNTFNNIGVMKTTMLQRETAPQAKRVSGGNQSAKSLPSHTIVHAKLEMTEPGDHDEREADAMANTIMSGGKIARKISSGGSGSSGIAVSQQMESQLSQLQGGGRQMPEGLRNMMESGFGQDFSQVRLHTDGEAASMSSSIHAKAFTHGNDIYFNRGQFNPETAEGQRLVAHELTHVVQGSGKVGRDPYIGPAIGPALPQPTKSEGITAEEFFSYVNQLKSIISSIKLLREINAAHYVDDIIEAIRFYNFDQLLAEGAKKAKLAEAGQGAARAVYFVGKKVDIGLWLFSVYMDLKRVYEYRHDEVGAVYYSIRALATMADCPFATWPPHVKAVLLVFNTSSGIGDLINETLMQKIYDYYNDKSLREVTKDDVLNYFNFAKSRIAYELYIEYNKLSEGQKKYITIYNSSKNGVSYKFDAFMRDYQKSLKAKNDGRFLKNCFVYSSTTSFPAGNSRINNLDIFILKKAFQRVGLY